MSSGIEKKATTFRYRFGDAEFDENTITLTVSGEVVDLEPRPLALLNLLLANVDEVMTKEELLEQVWIGQITVDNVLANAIAKLRKALGDTLGQRIVTHPRIGYRLVGPVDRTVAGQKVTSDFSLKQGMPVPKRENFHLKTLLSSHRGREVWIAQHKKTKERRIFKFANDGEALRSLKREVTIHRLALASENTLQFSARVLDWNFGEAPFFLECEYGGLNLREWLLNKYSNGALTQSDQIQLAADICRAVASFHSLGVVHKDLKPTNILIDETTSTVKLIDFGSGTMLERERLDAFDITPMGMTKEIHSEPHYATAGYIAPELLQGQPSSLKSDIYALGVVIYQILCGDIDAPLTTDWQDKISEPLLVDDIRSATHADPDLRISSANQLAENLSNFDQRKSALEAQRQAELKAELERDHKRRARARRPWLVASAMLLVGGIAITSYLAVSANKAKKLAEIQTQRAEASKQFLGEMIVGADPRETGQPTGFGIVAAIDRAQSLLEQRFEDDAETKMDLLLSVAQVYRGLENYGKTAEAYGKAAELVEWIYGEEDPRRYELLYKKAMYMAYNQQWNEARKLYEETSLLSAAKLESYPGIRVNALNTIGMIDLNDSNCEEGVKHFEAAQTIYDNYRLSDIAQLAEIKFGYTQCLSRVGRQDEALDVAASLMSVPFSGSSDIPYWRTLSYRETYADALSYSMRYEESLAMFEKLIVDVEALYGIRSRQYANISAKLGIAYAGLQRWEPAYKVLSNAEEIICEQQGMDNGRCMNLRVNTAVAAIEFGNWGNSEETLLEIREVYVGRVGDAHPVVQVINYHIVRCLLERKASSGEIEPLIAALDVESLEQASPGNYWKTRIDGLMGRYKVLSGKLQEGRDLLSEAIARMHDEDFTQIIIDRHQNVLNSVLEN